MAKNEEVIAIYSRKSRFTGKGESIGNQVELCRGYIRTAFGEDYADRALVFEDEGFSGGNLNRPDFKRMMEAARGHRFRAVVVYRLDRISRNIGDFSALIEELGRLGIDFVSIRERFDTASPMGRAMMYIASVFSQLERETIAERIRDNMRELAKTGRWLGGITPTGYASQAVKTVTVEGKSKRSCMLRLIPQEAETVRLIYALYHGSGSLTETEAELLRRHCRTKNGRDFTRFSIRAILQNPVYLIADQAAYRYFADHRAELFSAPEAFDGVRGILAYNRTEQKKGSATRYLPMEDWIISVGQHPGLIQGEDWVRVQELLAKNSSKSYRTPRSNAALLAGLLWCRCGGRMYPKCSGKKDADGNAAYRYLCSRKEHSKGALCSTPNLSGDLLDSAVIEQIKQLREDRQSLIEQLERGERQLKDGEGQSARLQQLCRRRRENARRIEALVDALASFEGSEAAIHLKERLEALHEQAEELQRSIDAERARNPARPLDAEEFDRLRRRLAVFRDGIDGMTAAQKRGLIRATVQQVLWDGQCARLFWRGGAAGERLLCEDSK